MIRTDTVLTLSGSASDGKWQSPPQATQAEARVLPALHKAIQLGRGLGAKLELFHALTRPVYAQSDGEFQEISALERERALQRLERLAARIRGAGRRASLQVSVAAEWDRPAYEAVVRRALAIRADLIVAEQHRGRHVAPTLLLFNDWELLRQSPVPLLIVKRGKTYRRPAVLAAVDPAHGTRKPPALDQQILKIGTAVSTALAGRLHAVHAFEPIYAQLGPQALNDKAAEVINTRTRTAAHKRFSRLLSRYRIPVARRHLLNMAPTDAIESKVNRLGAQLVVLGALSRSGWKRQLIGNTAETILNTLRCDLLIVKPPQFTTGVARTSSGACFVPVKSLMVT